MKQYVVGIRTYRDTTDEHGNYTFLQPTSAREKKNVVKAIEHFMDVSVTHIKSNIYIISSLTDDFKDLHELGDYTKYIMTFMFE